MPSSSHIGPFHGTAPFPIFCPFPEVLTLLVQGEIFCACVAFDFAPVFHPVDWMRWTRLPKPNPPPLGKQRLMREGDGPDRSRGSTLRRACSSAWWRPSGPPRASCRARCGTRLPPTPTRPPVRRPRLPERAGGPVPNPLRQASRSPGQLADPSSLLCGEFSSASLVSCTPTDI